MNRHAHWKLSLTTTCAALLLAACGATPDEHTAPQQAPQGAPATGTVSASLYPEYDPAYHCIVSSSHVPCNNGYYMNTYWSSDVGYYIERNVCDRYGGPTLCPFE